MYVDYQKSGQVSHFEMRQKMEWSDSELIAKILANDLPSSPGLDEWELKEFVMVYLL